MAYLGGDQVLLYGGSNGGDETWVYSLSANNWTNTNPANNPSWRSDHGMAYLGEDQVLLFGGSWSAERTYVYDLSDNTWTKKSPTIEPSARYRPAMAYMGGDRALLFGGSTGGDETWIYDLSDNIWTQDVNTVKPPAKWGHTLAETSLNGSSYLIMFGGMDGGDETWTFGGGDYSLPIELSSFTAIVENGRITLRWVTKSEVNNLGFYLYRALSEDGRFQRITNSPVQGHGTSSVRHEYSYIDSRVEDGRTYWYISEDLSFAGRIKKHGPVSVRLEPEELPLAPDRFTLYQNYPNPFNPFTTIAYDLPNAADVTLSIYALGGQWMTTLIQTYQQAGHYELIWEGQRYSTGTYIYRLDAGSFTDMKRMALVR